MASRSTPGSPRRRIAAGLLIAALVGVLLAWWASASVRAGVAAEIRERVALVEANALVDLVTAARAAEAPLDPLVDRFAAAHPEIGAARVVDAAGRRLEASTVAADAAESAPPRRLQREEKPWFDTAERLRAAVETNRAEGRSREDEIEIERRGRGAADGAVLALAVPLEESGEVYGAVLMETAPVGPPPRPPLLPALAAALAPALLFLLAAPLLAGRRLALVALGAVLLLTSLAIYGGVAMGSATGALDEGEALVAEKVAAEQTLVDRLAAGTGLAAAAAAFDPAGWDSDLHRRPRGRVGAPDDTREALAAARGGLAGGLRKGLYGGGALALALFAFIGLGGAARLGATLSEHRQAYLYTMPALIGMLLLVFFPFFYGITLSFTNQNILNLDQSLSDIWVGLDNYVDILSDVGLFQRTDEGLSWDYQNFYWTLGFTIVWTVTNVTLGVTVGLLLALVLNTKGLALRPFYRVILILPWAVPNYITALIWKGMFHQQFGVINQIIQIFGGQPLAWFDTPLTSFATVLATNGWLSFPFMMVICLGALQSIPADLYEAARVDGASRWQQFRSVTLPSIKPALVPAVVISVIWTFNMINIIYLVSEGEPAGATEILISDAYKIAFEQYRYGYAAAYSTVIFFILLIYGWFQVRVTRATEAT